MRNGLLYRCKNKYITFADEKMTGDEGNQGLSILLSTLWGKAKVKAPHCKCFTPIPAFPHQGRRDTP